MEAVKSLLSLKESFREYLDHAIDMILQDSGINTFEFLEKYGHKAEAWLFYALGKLLNNPTLITEYEAIHSLADHFEVLSPFRLSSARLLGGHFRGISTIEGRRSAIVIDQECYNSLGKINIYFFDKVFLRLYFVLFRRRDTLNELWIARSEKSNKGVLTVDFQWVNKVSSTLLEISEEIKLTVGKEFCDLLLTKNIFETYLNTIAQVTLSEKIDLLTGKVDGHNQYWNKLVDQVTSSALKIVEGNNLRQLLEARQTVFVDEIASDRNVVDGISELFQLDRSEQQSGINQLGRIAPALQGMLLYCRLSKSRFFYSLPYIKQFKDNFKETASLTVMTANEIGDDLVNSMKEISKSLFDPIIEKVSRIENNISARLQVDINKRHEDEKAKENVSRLPSVSGLRIKIAHMIENQISSEIWNKDKLGDLLPELCMLGSKLKNKKHEGLNLQFTFILAPVTSLGIQFKPLHLLGERLISQLDLLKEPSQAKSIINGNFAFLQRDNVALFAPYPFGELVFTHMVDLDHHPVSESGSLDSRVNLLKSASEGESVFIVATFKEGTG